MSTFYSGGGCYGGDNSLDYNNLLRAPIKNLIGTSSAPIVLVDLDYGNYLLYGVYRYNSSSTLITESNSKNISVTQDTSTGNKIITMEKVVSGEHYTVVIEYSGISYTETSTKTADSSATIAALKTEIEDARVDVSGNTYNSLNERLDSDFKAIEMGKYVDYEGEYITANNSSLGLTDGLEVRGKTYQNLARLDLPESELFNAFRGVLSNGIYTLSETAVVIAAPRYRYNMNLYKPNTAYTFVFNVYSNTSNTTLRHVVDQTVPSLFNANFELIPIGSTGIIKVLMTTSNFANVSDYENIFRFYMQCFTGEANLGSLSFSLMILEGDYTNVDLPPTITGIESVDSPTIKTIGKNLWKYSEDMPFERCTLEKNGDILTMTPTTSDPYIGQYYSTLGTTYSTTGHLIKINSNSVMIDTGNDKFVSNYVNIYDRDFKVVYKYTFYVRKFFVAIPEDLDCMYLTIRIGTGAITDFSAIEFSPFVMFADSNIDYTYEPYTEDSVSYDVELRRVGDVYDYVDVANNRIVRNIGVVELTSGGIISIYSTYNGNGVAFSHMLNDSYNSVAYISNRSSYNSTMDSINNMWIGASNQNIYWIGIIDILGLSTVDEFKAWLDENETYIYYQLATPTYEDLPTNPLKTYDGTTQIFSEDSNVEPQIYARVPSELTEIMSEILVDIDDAQKDIRTLEDDLETLKVYSGMTGSAAVGVEIDMTNQVVTRINASVGKTAGSDFDSVNAFGGRRRCNISDAGVVNAYYGDSGYTEDGSNGQVMVEQPAFYYKVIPIELEPIADGVGYHLRKARYYISDTKIDGFELHPAFKYKGGIQDKIYLSAYECCAYDVSANAYLLADEAFDIATDKMSSIAGAQPTSGQGHTFTRAHGRKLAQNRGDRWEQAFIETASLTQLLMLVEYASFDIQTALGAGITTKTSGTDNESEPTGATSALGNASGTGITTGGYSAISYRGEENFYGNMWEWIDGLNIHCSGINQPYICKDQEFADNKLIDNFKAMGFTLAKVNGYVSAFGYSKEYDWTFLTSETLGSSSIPVGDYFYQHSSNSSIPISRLGGSWSYGAGAGAFNWYVRTLSDDSDRTIGSRLVYVPR